MKSAATYAAMSDPDLNRQFSRRWVARVDGRDLPVIPPPKTLEDLSLELVTDWRRQRREA